MELKEQIQQELAAVKSALTSTLTEAMKAEVKTATDSINVKLAGLDNVDAETKELRKEFADLVKSFNDMQLAAKAANPPSKIVTFGDAYGDAIKNVFSDAQKMAELDHAIKNKGKFVLDIKAVGNMTLSGNLTGDSVATYSQRQGLVPGQAVNFRDLIPTALSPTGLYVHYRETGSEGAIANQTEGAAKSQIDYDLTEVKTIQAYKAGFARFSKQMLKSLPFMESTLPRLLLRDFYKQENADFYAAVASGATGSTTTSKTVDVEQLVDYIANTRNANFNSSFVLVNHKDWVNLLLTKPSDYSVPGGVTVDASGNIRIVGVPVIPVSWATEDKAMIIDTDFIERVEGESLRVEFSFEDSDNFQRNLVTARIECFEALNLIRTDAHIYADFGNVS
jgi:hypothetical protein